MSYTTFQPIVNVYDDDTITVDWSDAEVESYGVDGLPVETPTDADGRSIPGKVLDDALGLGDDLTTADRLRRLAAYIEAHAGPVES